MFPTTFIRPCARSFSTFRPVLAGHNKWSKIQQRKGVIDAQKGALYGKFSHDIKIAVRSGGSADPEKNTMLAAVLKKARTQGVPKDNLEAALKRATERRERGDQQLSYEAMAAGSVGLIVECSTDNANRTNRDIRAILNEHGAHVAPVSFMFQRKGYIRAILEASEDSNLEAHSEQVVEIALGSGAEDFDQPHTSLESIELEFTCPPETLTSLTEAVSTCSGVELLASEVKFLPAEEGATVDEETDAAVSALVEALREYDDIINVWTTLPKVGS